LIRYNYKIESDFMNLNLPLIKTRITELVRSFRTADATFLMIYSVVVGLGSGLGAVGFRWLLGALKDLFFGQGERLLGFMGSAYVILIPALGGLIIGPIINRFARETKGHGVPEVMLAVAAFHGIIRPRIVIVKTLVSAICIGSGGSVGREGPIVQIGSALGSSIGQLFKLTEEKTKVLLACGAAGGIAATFNAPMAGFFFALEVILREYGSRFLSAVVLSSVTATVVSRFFLGNYPAFKVPAYQLRSPWELPLYFGLGLLAAGAAIAFIKILYRFEDWFEALKVSENLKPAIGGLALGCLGLFFPEVFGVGYESIELALYGKIAAVTVMLLVPVKVLATSITLGSGGSGGVFAPSLFIGAMLGEAYGILTGALFPSIAFPTGAAALVGMGAVFSGAAQAPISAILFLFEMTGNYQIILPLMITCTLSTFLVRQVQHESIYTKKLIRRGIDINKPIVEDLLSNIRVGDAMITDVIALSEQSTIGEATATAQPAGHLRFPVVNAAGDLVGVITFQQLRDAVDDGQAHLPLRSRLTAALPPVSTPRESIRSAIGTLGERHIGFVPVVEGDHSRRLVGLLTRQSLIEAYSRALKRKKESA
jgi:CIC family chloride channel protein